MKNVKTPMGLVLPSMMYAAVVALCITLGSAAMMKNLEIPLWAWVAEFFILTAFVAVYTERSIVTSEDGVFTIESRKNLVLSLVGGLFFILIVVVAFIAL